MPALKVWVMVSLLLAAGVAGGQEWSDDVLIYEGDGILHPGPMGACIAVDSQEDVHIVHTFQYRHPDFPQYAPLSALRYVKLDSHGQILSSRIISDSVDQSAGNQRVHVFGHDSLWVVYGFARDYIEPLDRGYALRCLDINGNPLGPRRVLQQNDRFGLGYVFDVRSDGAFVLAYPREGIGQNHTWLVATVQLPSGERTLDTAKVWRAEVDLYRPRGYIDNTDSLQVTWREAYYSGIWDAIFAKRVATNVPFDTTTVSDHVELTPPSPGNRHVPLDLQPLDSTRMVLHDDSVVGFSGISILKVLNRSDYSETSRLTGQYWPTYALEGDSIIGLMDYSSGSTYLNRYSVPDFELITSELITTELYVGPYTVSPAGERHLLLAQSLGNDNARLIYRYWRSELSASDSRASTPLPAFTVSPNPSRGSLTLSGPMEKVRQISVYDLLGRHVESLTVPAQTSEANDVTFSLNTLPAGTYFLRIEAGPHIVLKRITLLK